MKEDTNPDVIVDFITAEQVPNVGAETNRQQVERLTIISNLLLPFPVLRVFGFCHRFTAKEALE